MFIVVIASIMNLFVVQGGPVYFEWAFIRVSEQGVFTCLLIACRLLLMMAGMSLVTLTTMTLDLTEAFERLLSPFARIGVPGARDRHDHGVSPCASCPSSQPSSRAFAKRSSRAARGSRQALCAAYRCSPR